MSAIAHWRRAYRLNLAGLPLRRRPPAALRWARAAWRRARPYHLALGLTYECQCRCRHCAMTAYAGHGPELAAAEIERLIGQARRWGVVKLSFFGGEPLLHPAVDDLVAAACALGFIVNVNTNGLALDAARAGRFRRCGVAHVDVSLDWPEAGPHDRGRGLAGAFESAVAAIKACRAASLPVGVSSYVARDLVRAGRLRSLADLARDLGADSLRLVPPSAAGALRDRPEALLSGDESDAIAALAAEGFAYLESQRRGGRICPAVRGEFAYVAADGSLQPCPFVPVAGGNVRDRPLAELWGRLREQPFYGFRGPGCPMNATSPAPAREH